MNWHESRFLLGQMERLIGLAWKAFWVGLGASMVLVGQSVLASHTPPQPAPPPGAVAPPRTAPVLSPVDLGVDTITTRNPRNPESRSTPRT